MTRSCASGARRPSPSSGSLITRIALPLVAILTLGAGPIEVALLRGMDLAALLVVGLVAGAWVDRLRPRPVLIGADLGQAVLLGSIPAAFVLGALTFWHLLVVAVLAAILTTFFEACTANERKPGIGASTALDRPPFVVSATTYNNRGSLVRLRLTSARVAGCASGPDQAQAGLVKRTAPRRRRRGRRPAGR